MPVIMMMGGVLPGPDSIAGLQGWWVASEEVFSDAGVTPAVDTDLLYRWGDKTSVRYIEQTTAGNRPTYRTGIVNGQPVVRFGGATDDDVMVGDAISNLFTVGAKTAFTVYKHTANADTNLWGDTSSQVIQFLSSAGTAVDSLNDDGAADTAIKSGGTSGVWAIATLLHSGGTLYAGLSDTRTGSMTSVASGNTTSLAATFRVGAGAGLVNPLDGDIAEMVFYNVALSESDRQTVERYLASKYGITLPY